MKQTQLAKALAAVVFGSAFFAAGSAFAVDTADLTVTGTIVPSACTASFTGGGTVDFGTIKLVDLKDADMGGYNLIGTRDTTLTINCPTAKPVEFTVADAQKDSRINNYNMYDVLGIHDGFNLYPSTTMTFGLGTASPDGKTTVKLGSYSIALGTPVADGKTQSALWWENDFWNFAKYVDGSDSVIYSGGQAGAAGGPMGIGHQTGSVPNANVFNFPMTIKLAVNSVSALSLTEDVPLNGQAVFSVFYK